MFGIWNNELPIFNLEPQLMNKNMCKNIQMHFFNSNLNKWITRKNSIILSSEMNLKKCKKSKLNYNTFILLNTWRTWSFFTSGNISTNQF